MGLRSRSQTKELPEDLFKVEESKKPESYPLWSTDDGDHTDKKFNSQMYKRYLETGIDVPFPPDLYHLFKLKLKIR